MKKRINESEIDSAKRINRFLFILTILMLLVVIVGISFYVLYNKGIIKTDMKDKDKNTLENSVFSSDKIDLHIDDSRIISLFDNVKITSCKCDNYNIQDKIDVSNMSDRCRYNLASNYYRKYIVEKNGVWSISSEKVKEGYEYLFGYNTYKEQDSIYLDEHNNLTFNDMSDNYISNTDIGVYNDDYIDSYEKIISVDKSGNYLDVLSTVVFYNSVENVLCKDYDCNNVIEENVKDNNDRYYDLYLDHNKKDLFKYKYVFKMDSVGFYKYVGFEKTNN